jgi:hypothetical protein
VASIIADNDHYPESADSADFKPAAPHPMQGSPGFTEPASGEPPSAG